MKLNCFISNESLNGIDAAIYSIQGLDERMSPNERHKIAWRVSRSFPDQSCVPFHDGHEIFVLGEGPPEVQHGNHSAKLTESIKIDTTKADHRTALSKILNEHLRHTMRKQGYDHDYGTFIPKKPTIVRLDSGEPLQLYRDGCKYQVDVLENGHFLVWIDPKSRIKQSALEYIPWKIQKMRKLEVENQLKDVKVQVEPYNMRGRIESISWDPTPSTYRFSASSGMHGNDGLSTISLREYWQKKHRISISETDAPIIMVRLWGKQHAVPYPPSKVYLPTRNKSLPNRIRNSFSMPSQDRVRKTQIIASVMLDHEFNLDNHSLTFDLSMTSVHRLQKMGKVMRSGIVPKPAFLMGGTKLAQNPWDIKKFGPFSKPRHIPIYYVLPDGARLDLGAFHEELNQAMAALHLGSLQHAGFHRVSFAGSKPTRNDYWDTVREVCRQLTKQEVPQAPEGIESGRTIILSILPGKDSNAYAGGKQAAHKDDQVIQDITMRTAEMIVNGKRFMAENTVIQLYLKCLNRGEAPWILEQPAGRAKGTAYLGYDVSRRFDEEGGVRKESAATISMVDGLGRHILNQIHTTQTGEKLDENTANQIIFDVSREAKDTFEDYGTEFNRLVIFKDGIIRRGEVTTIQRGVLSAVEDMLPKTSMPDRITIELVSVVKSSIERLYEDNGDNVGDGVFVVFSDGSAVVANSHLGNKGARVTVKPTRIEQKFRITEQGEMKIPLMQVNQLVHEFCDLCNLDWASIYHQPKYPIVLQLVQSLGEQYTLDISTQPIYHCEDRNMYKMNLFCQKGEGVCLRY